MTPVLFHFHRDRKRRDVRAMGNTETNTRNHGPPFSLLPPARSFSRLFHHFSRGSYTLWERALATRVIIAAPVSWKKKEKKKSRWKIEVEGNKESGLCSCPFLFLFSPGKRREERNSSSAPVSYRGKGGGSRCLPDVSDASVPLATTIYGRKWTMWLPQIYRDFRDVSTTCSTFTSMLFFSFQPSWYNLKIVNLF